MNDDQYILLRMSIEPNFALEKLIREHISEKTAALAFIYDQPNMSATVANLKTELAVLGEMLLDVQDYQKFHNAEFKRNQLLALSDISETLQEGLMTDAGLTQQNMDDMRRQLAMLELLEVQFKAMHRVLDAIFKPKD